MEHTHYVHNSRNTTGTENSVDLHVPNLSSYITYAENMSL